MPRAQTSKIYRTFVKGLITEASPLTYPENASIDEDNCVIFRKGNRTRRLGAEFEDGYQLSSYAIPASSYNDRAVVEYKWEAVDNQTGLTFLCLQVGTVLYFYDMSFDPLSEGEKSFTIDLTAFLAPFASSLGDSRISMASGNGVLFVVGEQLEPFYVEYDSDADTITTKSIYIQIRDFDGLDDGLANDEEPATLSNEHFYNLLNQGWFDPVNSADSGITISYFTQFGELSSQISPTVTNITSYFDQFGRYPPNGKQWFVAKSTSAHDDIEIGEFDPEILPRFGPGNNHAPRGHFVVNAFYIDRSAMSGIADIPVQATAARPNTVSFFGGRVWYACNSKVYFSQLLSDNRKAGFCYQEADPTSEDINDLIATDGGVIPIPEIGKVTRLFPLGAGLLVFANNGLWYISGTQAGFSATDLTVQKVSPIGTESPGSIIEAEGQVFWWSKIGIMGLSQKMGMFGAVEGAFDKQNIAETTIQSFYNNDITDEAKVYAKGVYDPATNLVQWLYKDDALSGKYRFNRVLNLDLTLQAFYPWSLTTETGLPFISGVFTTAQINSVRTEAVVTVGGSAVTVGGVDVTSGEVTNQFRSSFIKYLVAVPVSTNFQLTFGLFSGSNFADWYNFDGVGTAYESFVETGYDLLEDTMRKKQAPYVFCYFRRTEENMTEDEDGALQFDKPSSCMFQVRWDWTDNSSAGKWTVPIEAYRFTRMYTMSGAGAFENGYPVVVTKNKVRGQGRAIQFRFSSDEVGKDFDLLGWAVSYSGNTSV